MRQQDLMVMSLGQCDITSPLQLDLPADKERTYFVHDHTRIRCDIEIGPERSGAAELSFEEAGPRARIFFEPASTTAAIVTCGGLSPGLNNVIYSVFSELTKNYHVPRVLGIRNGYFGLTPDSGREPIRLTADLVGEIHKLGGTVLGSSRGPQDPAVMVEFLHSQGIDMLFCLGGDGTQQGAQAIHEEVQKRNLPIAVVGIPKTIDNDVQFVSLSFGYVTALEKAAEVVRSAHVEARDAINGIGLVKLMGRHAGYIAAGATVVSQEVNFTLVPEIDFPLDGENGFLPALARRIEQRGHAVVVVAEGAGQHLFEDQSARRDASGNPVLEDIGPFLRDKIKQYFKSQGTVIALKYLDPSYHIRSVPADTYDRYLCDQMGRHAVHAAMAGKTGMLIGFEHDQFIHVPIPVVVARQKRMPVHGDLWRAVLQVTGQPRW